jgi:hypothetical protein
MDEFEIEILMTSFQLSPAWEFYHNTLPKSQNPSQGLKFARKEDTKA